MKIPAIAWTQLDTGNLMSHGSRFLVTRPECIKACCTAYDQEKGVLAREQRVRLVDRITDPLGVKPKKTVYLCLTVKDACVLAEEILAGKGALSV